MQFTDAELSKLPSRYRANLMNTLSGYKPANLVGTKSAEGINNLAIFNSALHIGSNPPLLGLLFRPLTVRRDTYENIKKTGYFTINAVSEPIYRKAHQTAAKYEREESEFDATGLTPQQLEEFPAPFVEQSPIKLGCQYQNEYPIAENGTILLLGAVKFITIDDGLIETDGTLTLDRAGIVAAAGLDGYALPKMLDRLSYARPGLQPQSLKNGT